MSVVPSVALTLLERDAELAALDASISAAASGLGCHVVIEGEAGIGKSALLAATAELAERRGLPTLAARGSELERTYPYGVVLELFGRFVRNAGSTRPDLFAGPASAAEELFGSRPGAAAQPAADPFATIHGLYWLALNAAERVPVALLIDDAQWADPASLRFLHYLAQRVAELPIVLVTAFRTDEEAADDPIASALRNRREAVRLEPAPLSEAAVCALLATFEPTVDRATARSVFRVTGGNPFFVVEVGRDRRAGKASEPRLVPESVARFVDGRIAGIDVMGRRVAEAIAVLGVDAELGRVARLTGVDVDAAAAVARDLARRGMLDATGPLGFVHPLVHHAVYERIPAVARARMHGGAARVLAEDGAPSGAVGAQLLVAERAADPDTVAMLRRAADEAMARGEPAPAAALLSRALDEPPAPRVRPELLIALARAEAQLASPAAIARFREALAQVETPRRRAELLLELGHALIATAEWSEATSVFEEALKELRNATGTIAEEDRELHDQLEAGFVSSAWVVIDRFPEAEAIVERILREEQLGDVHRRLAVWAAFQRSTVAVSTADEQAAVVRRAIGGVPMDELIRDGQLVQVASGVLVSTDELDLQVDLLTRAADAAERAGLFGKLGVYLYCRTWPSIYTGRLTDAIADAQASLRIAELGWETFVPATRAALAMALVERGELDAAAEAAELDEARWGGRIDTEVLVPLARGRIALARGDAEAALEQFQQAGRIPTQIGMRLLIPTEWRIWTIVAMARLGRRDEARTAADEALAIARSWGARWALGCATRAAAIADGGSAGLELFREAIALLEPSPAQLERARTLVEYGAALRRLGHLREARDVLRAAMDLAHRLGALALLDESREELLAAGARPRRFALSGVESLTPAELRVARLAADGRSNREISQVLFVTPKAVEYHLANAYPKLGITSRRELADAL